MASKICPDCNKSFYGRFNRCIECSKKRTKVDADDYELMQEEPDYTYEVDVQHRKIDDWLSVCDLCDKFGNHDCVRNSGEYQTIPNRLDDKEIERLNKCPIYWYAKQDKTPGEVVRILSYV